MLLSVARFPSAASGTCTSRVRCFFNSSALVCARDIIPATSIPAALADFAVLLVGTVAFFKLLMIVVLAVLMFSLLVTKCNSSPTELFLLPPNFVQGNPQADSCANRSIDHPVIQAVP